MVVPRFLPRAQLGLGIGGEASVRRSAKLQRIFSTKKEGKPTSRSGQSTSQRGDSEREL